MTVNALVVTEVALVVEATPRMPVRSVDVAVVAPVVATTRRMPFSGCATVPDTAGVVDVIDHVTGPPRTLNAADIADTAAVVVDASP